MADVRDVHADLHSAVRQLPRAERVVHVRAPALCEEVLQTLLTTSSGTGGLEPLHVECPPEIELTHRTDYVTGDRTATDVMCSTDEHCAWQSADNVIDYAHPGGSTDTKKLSRRSRRPTRSLGAGSQAAVPAARVGSSASAASLKGCHRTPELTRMASVSALCT